MRDFLISLLESHEKQDHDVLIGLESLKDIDRNIVDAVMFKIFGYSYQSLMEEYENFKPMFEITDKSEAFAISIAFSFWLQHNWIDMDDKYAAYGVLTDKHRLIVRESFDDIDEDVLTYYNQLTEENWSKAFDELTEYLDNEWNEDE